MGRSLSSGSSISHYNVISPLGAGGMGEVYIARDLSLDRSVALKILPPDLVRNEERVRRFIQEAKAASALSHPHIVTIYEIGQGVIRPADSDGHHEAAGEVSTAKPIHFIAMELVSGETIAHKIHHEKTNLRTLLEYLAQAADGLAKAHAAGIVHRDLKPENIMVTKDGYAKVLDFGLAKLTEKETPGGDVTIATPASEKTIEGSVLGTVGYMSPEQVQGKAVDLRADIFAFGCILYEAATRRRAFKADSDVETMYQILRDNPPPIEDLNPDTPAELRRVIRRCLAKSPDQRLQSMKDLALELREIVDEFPNLPVSSVSRASGASATALAAGAPRRPGARLGVAAAIVLGLGGLALGIYALGPWRKSDEAPTGSFQSMQMTRLTTGGEAFSAALSPDGRYLAQVRSTEGRWSLWVQQIATGSEIEIVPEQDAEIGDVSFSPDGDYLFYRGRDPETPNYSALFQVASLGGTPRKLLFDVDTAVTFSPDGRQVAFLRGYPQFGETALMVANADGSSERKLAVEKRPRSFKTDCNPSWSADGRRIALVASRGPVDDEVVTVTVEDGKSTTLSANQWIQVRACAWLPDDSALVLSGLGRGASLNQQIWEVAYPSGRLRRITNDLNEYTGVSITADGQRIATVQSSRIANLWVAPASDPSAARAITTGSTSEDAISDFAVAMDGRILFRASQDRYLHLFSIGADGSGRRQLTSGPSFNIQLYVARAAGVAVFTSIRGDMIPHVFKMDLDGGNLVQVTTGSGEFASGIDPRGQWALHTRIDSSLALWRVPLAGGSSTLIVESAAANLDYSPDGERIAYLHFAEVQGRIRTMLTVIPAAGGAPLQTLPAPLEASTTDWAPTGDAIDYVRVVDGKWNLWRQPLSGGEPRRLTDFPDMRIFHFHWSPDGKQLVLSRGDVRTDVVTLSGFR